jgi:hypothetical protein
MRHSAYAAGYQDALRELAEILERDGLGAMTDYLRRNTAATPSPLDLSGRGADYCPACGRRIRDHDTNGREDSNGQRHCAGHAPATCDGHDDPAETVRPL